MNAQTIKRVKVFSLSLVLLAVACVASFSRLNSQAQTRSQTKAATKEDMLKEFAAYRTWEKVNAVPLRVNNFVFDGQLS